MFWEKHINIEGCKCPWRSVESHPILQFGVQMRQLLLKSRIAPLKIHQHFMDNKWCYGDIIYIHASFVVLNDGVEFS